MKVSRKGTWKKYKRGHIGGLLTYDYISQMLGQEKARTKREITRYARRKETTTFDLTPAQIMDFLMKQVIDDASTFDAREAIKGDTDG
jgi:hypothetical protein